MGWKIVMEEELTAHDVEWDVMCGPGKEEETSRVVEAGAGTLIKSFHSTSKSQLIGTNDTSEHSKKRRR